MNKISIFGGEGFIGSWFASTYPDEVQIIPRDNIVGGSGDILYMRSTVHNYHPKEGNPLLDIETNLLHFMKVLDLNASPDRVFNLISTWFVYSNKELPAKETSPCEPKGFYSITALCREQLLKSYCETFNLKFRILRLANVIGIGDKKASPKKNALQWMVKQLAQGKEVNVYKSDAVRDYIDVRDCVRAIKLVMEKGELNQTYNISNGKGYSVRGLVQHAHTETGFIGKVGSMEVPDFHKIVQVTSMYLDNSKIKKLGYVQQHDIKMTISELAKHYQTHEY